MPTVEGKEARIWIDEYIKNAGKQSGVAKAVRALHKQVFATSMSKSLDYQSFSQRAQTSAVGLSSLG